jgi:hypothetical protein
MDSSTMITCKDEMVTPRSRDWDSVGNAGVGINHQYDTFQEDAHTQGSDIADAALS